MAHIKHQVILDAAEDLHGGDNDTLRTGLALLQAAEEITYACDSVLTGYGLSQGRLMVLLLLCQSPGGVAQPSQLAMQAAVTRATMTDLVDGLERAGLVGRRRSPKDRRTCMVCLTSQGKRLLERALPLYAQRLAAPIRELLPEQRQMLLGLLSKVSPAILNLERANRQNAQRAAQ